MSWAARRRFLIAATLVVVALIIFSVAGYAALYHPPTCQDGVQNQGESGVDCGGPCNLYCQSEAEAPVVRFTQALPGSQGRTDVIAYIDNPNQNASARGAAYIVSLFDAKHVLAIPTIAGSVDLPPGATVPIFIPNISSSRTKIASAFISLNSDTVAWKTGGDTRVVPTVASQTLGGTAQNPRIIAVLKNPSALPIGEFKVIAAVFDAAGNVVAASQTLVSGIVGQGTATATFTWNSAFMNPAARIDILPIVPLPPASTAVSASAP